MPDETEETKLIDKGQWQLETAILFNGYEQNNTSVIGQALLRYGLADKAELRIIAEDGKNRDQYMEETVQSTSPLALGTKVSLVKDHKVLPDITLVAYVKLPFTSRTAEQKKYWSPILLAAFQNKFGEKWTLEYNAGLQQEAFSADWYWLANVSLHYKIADPLEVFTEYFAQYRAGEDPQNNLGGGIAYQLGQHIELYAAGGRTVNYQPYNYFASTGIAFR